MRYPKYNNPVRDHIISMKNEMKELGKDIRDVKNVLYTSFPNGICEEKESRRYRLYQVMLNHLRDKFRCMHLLYGLIREKPYTAIERNPHKKVNWEHVMFWASYYGLSSFIDLEKAIKESMSTINITNDVDITREKCKASD